MRIKFTAVWRCETHFVSSILTLALLSACGGGGGSTTELQSQGPDTPDELSGIPTQDLTDAEIVVASSQLSGNSNGTSVTGALTNTIDTVEIAATTSAEAGQPIPENNLSTQLTATTTIEPPSPEGSEPILGAATETTDQLVNSTDTTSSASVSIEEAQVIDQPQIAQVIDQPQIAEALPSQQFSLGKNIGDVEKIIDSLPVSKAQSNVQQTPIAVANGYLYTANIEHGPRGDASGFDLETVVRQGTQNEDGQWVWESTVVEDRTVHNKWHTAPSIEVDKQGLVHVVYNMHNFPWQYKRTTIPHNLDSFKFYGQAVSDEQIRLSFEENRTSFPTLGKAEIPGNQVTYPAFFKDQNNDLYLTYRFAARPNQSFSNRTMSSGISVYNSTLQTWTAIGEDVSLSGSDFESDDNAADESIAIASQQGWTSYHPRLVFDQNNRMYVNWFWRKGTAGELLQRPCLISTTDRQTFSDSIGNPISMPVEPHQCGNLGFSDNQNFFSIGNTAINSDGEIHILLSPESGARQIAYYHSNSNEWRHIESPHGATELFFDDEDTLWAIASGIRIFKRTEGSSDWEAVYDDSQNSNCLPKATLTQDKAYAFIHTEACSGGSATVFGLKLK